MFLAYGSHRGRALIDRELYLPKDWTSDRERCPAAGIGDEVEFATKPDIGLRMLKRAVESEVPFGWVTADELYGQTGRLRLWLEENDIPHVLAVPKSQMIMTMEFFGQARVHELIGRLPNEAWQRLSCGDGAHARGSTTGPRPRSGPGDARDGTTGCSPGEAPLIPRKSPTTSASARPGPHLKSSRR